MVRSKLADVCGVGALFRQLICRFTLQGDNLPDPGSAGWAHSYIYPGRAGMYRLRQ